MPVRLISCASLPPATILSVPINDFAKANDVLAMKKTEEYYSCCGKSICKGCIYSFCDSGNEDKCPFCNSSRADKTDEEMVGELMKRVEVNDAASIYLMASHYQQGQGGLQQDYARAIELFTKSADLGFRMAHNRLGGIYYEGGNLKKAKFHLEAAAMAGNEVARYNLGAMDYKSGKKEQAIQHWKIAASAGEYNAMHNLLIALGKCYTCRETIESTLTAYNNSCAEMRSKARDTCIQWYIDSAGAR
jgi:TPR repeat protein